MLKTHSHDSAAKTDLTKDHCSSVAEAAKPAVKQVCLTKSYCFICSYSCSVLCVDFKQTKSLNAIVVRKRAGLSQGGERLSSAARRCWQSSKPERASLFPIRGLSLSSRHWQHREKRKNSTSGIHLPSLFCLGTLPLSPSHTHSQAHMHIPKHILLSWLPADGQHELID